MEIGEDRADRDSGRPPRRWLYANLSRLKALDRRTLTLTLIGVSLLLLTWSPGGVAVVVRMAVTLGLLALIITVWRSNIKADPPNTVGELSDVLTSLGEQLRIANRRAPGDDATIILESAEVEFSLSIKTTADGKISLQVVEGKAGTTATRTSKVKVVVLPVEETLHVGN